MVHRAPVGLSGFQDICGAPVGLRGPSQFDGSQWVYGAQSVFGIPFGVAVEGPNGSERLPVNLRGSSRSERLQSVWRFPRGLQGPNRSERIPVGLYNSQSV